MHQDICSDGRGRLDSAADYQGETIVMECELIDIDKMVALFLLANFRMLSVENTTVTNKNNDNAGPKARSNNDSIIRIFVYSRAK